MSAHVLVDAPAEARPVALLPGYAVRESGVDAVYPAGSRLSPKVQVFNDHLVETAGGGTGAPRAWAEARRRSRRPSPWRPTHRRAARCRIFPARSVGRAAAPARPRPPGCEPLKTGRYEIVRRLARNGDRSARHRRQVNAWKRGGRLLSTAEIDAPAGISDSRAAAAQSPAPPQASAYFRRHDRPRSPPTPHGDHNPVKAGPSPRGIGADNRPQVRKRPRTAVSISWGIVISHDGVKRLALIRRSDDRAGGIAVAGRG